ncbi:MAG: YigZ family protein [Candidatus Woesearchaeota archaeon]
MENVSSFSLLSTYTHKIQRSSFTSHLYQISIEDDINTIFQQLKKEHLKSNHISYAAIIKSNTYIKHDSEVGSPGNVLYNIIYHNNYHSHMLVTVRYFGGIKLGVGGVIKGFKQSGVECINKHKETLI